MAPRAHAACFRTPASESLSAVVNPETPRRLTADTWSRIRQRADETVDGTVIADRAERPGDLLADAGFGIFQGLDQRRDRFG